jgi:hypothetical protein
MPIVQSVQFGTLPVIGADMVLDRGPRPGTCLLRVPYCDHVALTPADLTLQSDGVVTFAKCVPDLSTVRLENRPGGRREYVFLVRDRRQSWSSATVSGKYNQRYRDGTIKPSTKKTATELANILLSAVGEPESASGLPEGYYPQIDWNNTPVVQAFETLASEFSAHVCRLADDTYTVAAIGDGDALPDLATRQNPDFIASIERGPGTITVRCGPTLFQCVLELEAVGRDTDGQIKPIDDLSYMPTAGWGTQWPYFFSDVAIDKRHVAFDTVFRMYRVKVQTVPGCETTIGDITQLELDDVLVEMGGSGDARFERPAYVKGTFWPYTDNFKNTGPCTAYPGSFSIDKDARCVLFDRPVFAAGSCSSAGCVAAATLYLCTGFRVRDASTGEYVRKEFTVTRDGSSSEHVVCRPELYETVVDTCDGNCSNSGSPTLNTAAIQAEAETSAQAWSAHWDAVRDVRHAQYAGTYPISLSGKIAQISYRVGRNLYPITRASENARHT